MNRNHISDKNEISSEVENTSTLDCFLNAFSCAQIGQSSIFNLNSPISIICNNINCINNFSSTSILISTRTEDDGKLLISSEPEHRIYDAVPPNRISTASEGVITLSGKHSFNPLSPERIIQSNLRDKATYGMSFKCGDFSFASSILSSKVSRGISSSSLLMKEKTRMNSSLENSVNLNHFSISRSLLATAKLTSSANSLACSSVSFDLDTIDSISLISSSSLLRNLENSNCQSSFEILPSSIPISSGILTTNSAISITYNNVNHEYINNFCFAKSLRKTLREKRGLFWILGFSKNVCPLQSSFVKLFQSLIRGASPRRG